MTPPAVRGAEPVVDREHRVGVGPIAVEGDDQARVEHPRPPEPLEQLSQPFHEAHDPLLSLPPIWNRSYQFAEHRAGERRAACHDGEHG